MVESTGVFQIGSNKHFIHNATLFKVGVCSKPSSTSFKLPDTDMYRNMSMLQDVLIDTTMSSVCLGKICE